MDIHACTNTYTNAIISIDTCTDTQSFTVTLTHQYQPSFVSNPDLLTKTWMTLIRTTTHTHSCYKRSKENLPSTTSTWLNDWMRLKNTPQATSPQDSCQKYFRLHNPHYCHLPVTSTSSISKKLRPASRRSTLICIHFFFTFFPHKTFLKIQNSSYSESDDSWNIFFELASLRQTQIIDNSCTVFLKNRSAYWNQRNGNVIQSLIVYVGQTIFECS